MSIIVASLRTPTTRVQVTDYILSSSVEAITCVTDPIMTLMLYGPGCSAEGGYIDSGPRQLSKLGNVMFMAPDREVFGRGGGGKMRVVSCTFERSYFANIVGSLTALSRSQLRNCLDVRSSLLPAILSRLMTEAVQPGFISHALVDSLGHSVLMEWSSTVLSRSAAQPEKDRLTARHRRIIDDYLVSLSAEAPSVSAVAAACGLSERYFARIFRRQTGQTISAYLKAAQVSKAQAYLLQTTLPLKEIAHRLGFRTPSNFSVAFRAATGETPARYRAGNREGSKFRRIVP
jgi:AraC family transcriptional regulator